VLELNPLDQQPHGFSGARNQVLAACSGDWFLWIDADEQLVDGYWLRRYLDGAIFNGYVLQQTHLYIDGPPTHDVPVRVFRTGRGVQFYGCVHEQPQQGDCNADIFPTLEPFDVKIAHTGYLTERIRSDKRVDRNLPLLVQDQKVFRERLLGQVLCLRESVIQADELRAKTGGALTERAAAGYAIAVRLFLQHFDDPTHKYHKLARPWYEAALRHLGLGYEFEFALAGREGGLEGRRAGAERFWVRDADEAERIVHWKMASVKQGMAPPVFKTDPFVLPVRESVGVSA
jgi:glycosyltransferase involved in cell wall biosynthesis